MQICLVICSKFLRSISSNKILSIIRFWPIFSLFEILKQEKTELRYELMQVENKLMDTIDAQRNAEYINEAKTIFLAKVSHELRNPLTSIIGFSEMLNMEMMGPNKGTKESVENILNSSVVLKTLINDIIDLSKMESGHFELHKCAFSIAAAIQNVVRVLNETANPHKIHIDIEFKNDLPPILADETRIRQVITNLLSNAIKYTPEGEKSV